VDENLPDGHATLGWLYCLASEYDKAIAEGQRAVALNPNGADSHATYGLILDSVGRTEEAISMFQKATRLNPYGPAWYFSCFGDALRKKGRYEEAVSAYKKALQFSPDGIFAHRGLAATYGMMGREKDAQAEMDIANR